MGLSSTSCSSSTEFDKWSSYSTDAKNETLQHRAFPSPGVHTLDDFFGVEGADRKMRRERENGHGKKPPVLAVIHSHNT